MTKAAIKQAFRRLDPTDQAKVLGELAITFAEVLGRVDDQDSEVFDRRRKEESEAVPLADLKRRLRRPRGAR